MDFCLKLHFFTRCQLDESLLCFKNFQGQYPDYDVNLIINHAGRYGVNIDDVIRKSILIVRNYKSFADVKFLLGKYKIFSPIVYLILNGEMLSFKLLKIFVFKPYKSLRKKFKRLF
ncbi:MAG: hypothetical protein K6F04_03095 [bacterium]|nr:hypothetical protein [bacterium]